MGKIRVKAVGDEELERQQADDAKARKEARLAENESKRAKKAEKQAESGSSDEVVVAQPTEETKEASANARWSSGRKKDKLKKVVKVTRSKSYKEKAELVDKMKTYPQIERAHV